VQKSGKGKDFREENSGNRNRQEKNSYLYYRKNAVMRGGCGMRLCELRDKEVINICSGRRLGCIVDVEINVCNGEVEAVIIPGPGKICGFLGTDCEYVIPFACIRKIGPDIVIVEIQEEKFLQKF
jgi:YlmC/YmxH family sporulation protein